MQQDSRHPYKPDPYKAVRKPPSPGRGRKKKEG